MRMRWNRARWVRQVCAGARWVCLRCAGCCVQYAAGCVSRVQSRRALSHVYVRCVLVHVQIVSWCEMVLVSWCEMVLVSWCEMVLVSLCQGVTYALCVTTVRYGE